MATTSQAAAETPSHVSHFSQTHSVLQQQDSHLLWLDPKQHGRKGRAGQANVTFAKGTWKNLRSEKLIMESTPHTALQRGGLRASLTSQGMQAGAEVQAQQQAFPQKYQKGKCLGSLQLAAPLKAATDRTVHFKIPTMPTNS